ncbi:MAG TPA: transglutaminaseTgpA domain-containing protein [Thermoleophilaceae bacterium]|nr:transglutaminaseTgpA domain-containing protein [Thermoleophilaceae bacterium]
MSLFLDIGQGAGLAGSSGVRPYLPPLLAGALARGNIGLDFSGTSYAFLESSWWLVLMFALAVLSYLAERRRPELARSRQAELLLGALGLAFGALLFAGSLADEHHASWPGLIAGVACAALGFAAVVGLLRRTRRRLDQSAASFLTAYADAIALALAGLSIAIPPIAFLALAAFVLLIASGQRASGQKYEGLRILR